jgi:hypothetical protein
MQNLCYLEFLFDFINLYLSDFEFNRFEIAKILSLQGVWSILPKEGPSMGYYSAVIFSILFALPFSVLFYLTSPYLQKYLEIRFKTFKNLSTAFVLFGIFYFVIKEWKKWGIEKMGLKSIGFFGPEFWFFLFVLFLFLLLLKLVLILEKKIFE